MSSNVSRLTLYALLSAMEEDLRRLIVKNLNGHDSNENLLTKDLLERCFERMERDIGGRFSDATLADLIEYADFGDVFQILQRYRTALPKSHIDFIKSQTLQIERLIPIRNRVAHVRPLAFDDLPVTLDTAGTCVRLLPEAWPALSDVLYRLQQDPSFVLGIELPVLDRESSVSKHSLPLPDFDETGFIGRGEQVKQLVSLCLGPYPVITVVGTGGVGKTATALKASYDLLDMPQCPFDAIVWVTCKTTKLTPSDIVEVDGAIRSSLGMLEAVADELAGTKTENVIDEILSYLKEFRILLILDNLETVLDDRIRDFLARLPQGSKVLVTSRIGLGAFEYPVKLEGLKGAESVQLLRAHATARGIVDLVKMPNPRLEKYCAKMANNPGFIKWFVTAVQAGQRPEDALTKPDLFLDFCMSNVYNYLSDESRRTLSAMQCLPGRHSQAELAYLLDVEEITSLQRSLQQLLTTNLVRMYSVPVGSTFSSRYEVDELARSYLTKHHPPAADEARRMNKRKQHLRAAGESMRADGIANIYNINNVRVKSASDTIIAKFLRDALNDAKLKRYEKAQERIAKAKQLAPEYFEVHRVEGFIKSKAGDIAGSHEAYEAAIDLEPEWAPLRFWFGGFLMRDLDDNLEALSQFDKGLLLDPSSYDLQVERARALLYLRRFKDAEESIRTIVQGMALSTWQKKKVYDLYLQSRYRWAENLVDEHDFDAALKLMEELKKFYEDCPKNILDTVMTEHVRRAVHTANRLCQHWRKGADHFNRAAAIMRWLVAETGEVGHVQRTTLTGRTSVVIELLDATQLEVPKAALVFSDEWGELKEGQRVNFHLWLKGNEKRIVNLVIVGG